MNGARSHLNGRLILAGGGDRGDSRPADELFARWIGAGARLLYWPIAMPPELKRFGQCLGWLRESFEPLGVTSITMWTDLSGKTVADFAGFDALYLGGGCTYWLLSEIRKHGFGGIVTDFARSGGPIYGGSAGAIVLGRDIATCAHMDRNLSNLTDTAGLNLVNGFGVACHYRPQHDPTLSTCARQIGAPVLAMTERGSIVMEGGQLRAAGFEASYVFTGDARVPIPVGELVAASA